AGKANADRDPIAKRRRKCFRPGASLLRRRGNDNGRAMTLPPFHLAIPVDDLAAARAFYGDLLGCPEGRSAGHWVDFDLHGHQLVAHLAPDAVARRATNPLDREHLP